METLSLSLSTKYVSHWGLWEAMRELFQNALDAEARGFHFYYRDTPEGLLIGNEGTTLPRETLLLGVTDKEGSEDQVGKFGEGYKLALLVLCRLGKAPTILNGLEIWKPKLDFDPAFNSEVLQVQIESGEDAKSGIEFIVPGVSVVDIQTKWRPDLPLDKPLAHIPGEIYVRGLFVCKVEGFVYGYNFSPGRLKLDRDRGMVDGFNLSYQTSRIWSERKEPDEISGLMALMEAEALDVQYVTSHISESTVSGRTLIAEYRTRYPETIPVSTQAEIEKAQAAGKKWRLVPDALKVILWSAVGYFIPTMGTPRQRLQAWMEKYLFHMSKSMKAEFQAILEDLP